MKYTVKVPGLTESGGHICECDTFEEARIYAESFEYPENFHARPSIMDGDRLVASKTSGVFVDRPGWIMGWAYYNENGTRVTSFQTGEIHIDNGDPLL